MTAGMPDNSRFDSRASTGPKPRFLTGSFIGVLTHVLPMLPLATPGCLIGPALVKR